MPLTACRCVGMLTPDLGTTRIREAPKLFGERSRSTEWSRVTGYQPFGNGRRGAVPELRYRTRFRTGCGTTGTGPARGRRTGAKVSPNEEPRGARSWKQRRVTRGLLASRVR